MFWRFGFGRGWGRGFGWGRGWGGYGWGAGWGSCRLYPWLPRGWRWGYGAPNYPYVQPPSYGYPTYPQTWQATPWQAPYPPPPPTPPPDVNTLKEQARLLEEEIKKVKEKLDKMETGED